MDKRIIGFLPLVMALPCPSVAQQVHPCENAGGFPYEASVLAIAEPWADNTRSFADGQVRIVVMDTYEPALGAFYLMLLFDPLGEPADLRSCALVGNGTLGFPEMSLEGLEVEAVEGQGLRFLVPTSFYNPADDSLERGHLDVVLDRQAARVSATRR